MRPHVWWCTLCRNPKIRVAESALHALADLLEHRRLVHADQYREGA